MTFLKSHSPSKHFKSFKYAFSGILHALYHEANFRIQILITLISIFLGIYFQISAAEWSVLILSFSMLLSSEVINTSIENLIDFVVPKKSPIVKIIKDLSAGFVLINALAFLTILIVIFYGRIINLLV
jgi:diacylglycerol kinase